MHSSTAQNLSVSVWQKGEDIKKITGIILSGLIFLVCAYYVITYFQWETVFQIMIRLDWKWMPFAVGGAILLFWLFRTLRWFVLLKAAGVNVNFFLLYVIVSMSVALALITPFQSGEVLKVELLKKTGALERVPGYGIFVTERFLDLLVVLFIAAFSVLFGLSQFVDKTVVLTFTAFVLAGLAIFVVVIIRVSPANIFGRFFAPLQQCIKSGKTLITVLALTLCGWLAVTLGWYFSLLSISISLGFFEALAMTTITTLINLFSLIPWALGISEVSISSFLVYFKQDIALAQAGALMIRVYAVIALIMGFAFFIIWKFMSERRADAD
ncbi:MAG: lysylphosphatidylglycerol synthase transmembrane domain-containing protein [Smithella sp.]|nr:lysylphosphatidylglycerol synthase transmembrane domain-containing protein [Smithella sp.]